MNKYNYTNNTKDDGRKKDVLLDTSSINIILEDNHLLKKFFDKIHNINAVAVVPFTAFSEISDNLEVFHKFLNFYKKQDNLIIIWETLDERIKREIDIPIESNIYFKKDIDPYKIFDENCYKENNNKKLKEAWGKTVRIHRSLL